MKQLLFITLLLTISMGAIAQQPRNRQAPPFNPAEPVVHDPVVVKQGDTYYLFCTGLGIATFSSTDGMKTWKPGEPLFADPPQWAVKAVDGFRGHIWAPDVIHYNGRYHVFYSCSAFARNTSVIGHASASTLNPADPDYGWTDHGQVVQSVPNRDMWNAIDANIIVDQEGTPWMNFGSFWDGIKMVRLTRNNMEIAQPEEWYSLCRRRRSFGLDDTNPGDGAVEAPFIMKHGNYYYLFVSFDYCCRGANSDYKIAVGRSTSVTGPYLDKAGVSLAKGGGSILLEGNEAYAGAGHCAAYSFDGQDYLIAHAYKISEGGASKLIVRTIRWDENDWPAVDALDGTQQAQQKGPIQISVNAATHVATLSDLLNGTNIEDLNNQTNGGIFSQLIHGEAFEENIDIDFLGLPTGNYVKVYVVLDEMRRPHFLSQANVYNRITWNNLSEKYDFNSKDIYAAITPLRFGPQATPPRPVRPDTIGPLVFYGRFMVYDSIPGGIRNELEKRINGDEQISRYWTKLASEGVQAQYTLKRGEAYMGRQDQVIKLIGRSGEAGLLNAGLNKQGIAFESGKTYDGVLRIKCHTPTTVYLSLRNLHGKILTEIPYPVKGDGSWERLNFELTPEGSCPRGSFGISLKQPGEITLGFAFLQPGEWGRVKGLPVRKMMVDALRKQGISVIRYNGSMVDVGADTYLYRWKKMIGPPDERRVAFRSGFNPYATHSFGLEEMMKVAEALEVKALVLGMSMDETSEDIRDFVQYANADTSTPWGKRRAENGHPEPYNLRYIEVDNERMINRGYVEAMKKFALAAWKADPGMHIVASLNIGTRPESYTRGTEQYRLAVELFRWFIEQGKPDKMVWDPHYSGQRNFADHPGFEREMGIELQRELQKDLGHTLTLTPLEENGSRCDWDRGLAHANNWNTLQRYGNHFAMLATANTLQPHGQHYMWDQGRVHYTTNEIWFQPSAHIDEKISKDWLPNVVEAISSADSILDVTAKLSDDRQTLQLCVVNLSPTPQPAAIHLGDFRHKGKVNEWMIGDCDLTACNTAGAKETVAPEIRQISLSGKGGTYTFPRYSYTILTFRK